MSSIDQFVNLFFSFIFLIFIVLVLFNYYFFCFTDIIYTTLSKFIFILIIDFIY